MTEKRRTRWQRRPGRRAANYRGMTGAMPRPGVKHAIITVGNEYLYCHHVLVLGRYYETAGSTTFVTRPGGIEGGYRLPV